MYDLDTIKRINRAPLEHNTRDNPAPQPTKADSLVYDMKARVATASFNRAMQSPAMEREALE